MHFWRCKNFGAGGKGASTRVFKLCIKRNFSWILPLYTSFYYLCFSFYYLCFSFYYLCFSFYYLCLGVACCMHFWQNDRGLSRATALTQVWNGHHIKSQYTKLTLEKKSLTLLLPGFKLATFWSRVWRSNEVGGGWLCCCAGIVWEPIRKGAHTQLVREHSASPLSSLGHCGPILA